MGTPVKIKDIKKKIEGIEVTATVLKKWSTQRSQWREHASAMISDGTGEMRLNLWNDQVKQVEIGDRIKLKSAFAASHKGVMELSTWEEKIQVMGHAKASREEKAQRPD